MGNRLLQGSRRHPLPLPLPAPSAAVRPSLSLKDRLRAAQPSPVDEASVDWSRLACVVSTDSLKECGLGEGGGKVMQVGGRGEGGG